LAHSEKPSAAIRTLVVDDEPLARCNLTVLLRCAADIGLIAECASGADAIKEIRRTKPDLVFLDVQMPECDGFDVLEILGSDLQPAVVFVMAHDEYALRAFDASALDYLLKPFDDARFQRALNRAKDKLAHYAEQVFSLINQRAMAFENLHCRRSKALFFQPMPVSVHQLRMIESDE
jgi:two-component system LytT family response regulator